MRTTTWLEVRASTFRMGSSLCVLALALSNGGCSKNKAAPSTGDAGGAPASVAPKDPSKPRDDAPTGGGLSAPIAATRLDDGSTIVAGLDVPAHAIRVQRVSEQDAVEREELVLDGVAWSSDAELKVLSLAGGVAVTWRGKRAGASVQQALVLDRDLHARAPTVDVPIGACATRDRLWFTDGREVRGLDPRDDAKASVSRVALSKDDGLELSCGDRLAFALADRDDGTVLWWLDGSKSSEKSAPNVQGPLVLLRNADFGSSEMRERAVYTVGDDLGVVRFAESGAMAVREFHAGKANPLHKLERKISEDDDVVGVDASSRVFVVFYTHETREGCSGDGSAPSRTAVMALRVDRSSFAETLFELSPGECGREIGPFFTGSIADGVSLAWAERAPVTAPQDTPVTALAHRLVPASGALTSPLGRLDQPADVLVDAGCTNARCAAVALARKPGDTVMVPGSARVLRFP